MAATNPSTLLLGASNHISPGSLCVAGVILLLAFIGHMRKISNRERLRKQALRPGTSPVVVEQHSSPLVLLDLFLSFEESCYRAFAWLLRMPEAQLDKLGPDGCETRFKVTRYLCRKDKHGFYLPCGTILAMFDETSSFGQTFSDKNYRVGVSITLDVELLETITPGSTLRMTIKSIKQGKTLAFLEMTLRDEDTGKLVAVGKHIKYVQMNTALVIMSYLWRTFSVGLLPAFPIVDKQKTPERESLYDYFPLHEMKVESDKLTAKMPLDSHHSNFFETLHGGASAVLMEEAALRHRQPSSSKQQEVDTQSFSSYEGDSRIRGMKISYMSPVRHTATVRVTSLGEHSSKVELVTGDRTSVQSVLRWQDSSSNNSSQQVSSPGKASAAEDVSLRSEQAS